MFKYAPLNNEGDLRIMFGPIVCTNETILVPGVGDANSSPDGHEEDILGAGENSTSDPSSTALKGKHKVFHDSPKPRKKKELRDEYMRRMVDAFESRTFSSNKLKGKCALGPFLSILVIKCQHKWFKCETMANGGRSAKSTQRYDSRLSTLVFVY
jgi:hypothetical protein